MKLDAKFYGIIRKAKDDTIVPDDEYVVFLIQDTAFYLALPAYRVMCVSLGCDAEQIASLDRMIARIEAWRTANPNRCKRPDAKGEKLLG